MSREYRIPVKSLEWIKEGKPVQVLWEFLSSVDRNNAIIEQGNFNYKQSFADLAAINDEIPNPDDWLSVLTDQGLAVYNPNISGGTWVLASDNTTVIT